jgi:hypothetical protein
VVYFVDTGDTSSAIGGVICINFIVLASRILSYKYKMRETSFRSRIRLNDSDIYKA